MVTITHETYALMKELIAEYEKPKLVRLEPRPYLITDSVVRSKEYNPDFNEDALCECDHPYYRHFDTYEQMENVGCKYCGCRDFKEKI